MKSILYAAVSLNGICVQSRCQNTLRHKITTGQLEWYCGKLIKTPYYDIKSDSDSGNSGNISTIFKKSQTTSIRYYKFDRENENEHKKKSDGGSSSISSISISSSSSDSDNGNNLVCYIGGYKECLDRAVCSQLYIARINCFAKSTSFKFQSSLSSASSQQFPKIDSDIYELVAEPIRTPYICLQVYSWTLEYCQALLLSSSSSK